MLRFAQHDITIKERELFQTDFSLDFARENVYHASDTIARILEG